MIFHLRHVVEVKAKTAKEAAMIANNWFCLIGFTRIPNLMGDKVNYKVIWEIDIEADSLEIAEQTALEWLRSDESICHVYEVSEILEDGACGSVFKVDLDRDEVKDILSDFKPLNSIMVAVNRKDKNDYHSFTWSADDKLIINGVEVDSVNWELIEYFLV